MPLPTIFLVEGPMDANLAAQATPDEIRRLLSVPFLLEVILSPPQVPAQTTPSRLKYHSPFRPDSNPSFDVWKDERGWRWGDYPEGTAGSAIDLVARMYPDIEPVGKSRDLLVEQVSSRWVDPVLEAPRPTLDSDVVDRLEQGKARAEQAVMDLLTELIDTRPALAPVPPRFLVNEWGVVRDTTRSGVLVPYYNADGELFAVKARSADRKLNLPGSRLILYGLWRMRPDAPVLLVEGESDAWAASFHLPEFDVLAVPGAGNDPERVGGACLTGRKVLLALDADEAGRRASVTWAKYLHGIGCSVLVAPLPDGADLCSLPPGLVATLPERQRPVQSAPPEIVPTPSGYIKMGRSQNSTPVQLSSWVFHVERLLREDGGGWAFEGNLMPHDRTVVLPSECLGTQGALTRWCNQYGAVWTGGSNDHQKLMQYLLAEAAFVPEGRMTRTVGYHDGDFVWPDGHIGTDDWTYVPPVSDINLSSRVLISQAPCDPVAVVDALLKLYDHRVIGPILAWLAVAPIRPLFDRFPILSISGGSGTGKTTLTEKVLRIFSGSEITTNLTSTTPYAVAAFFACSNAVPIWFDEYRPGARVDAKSQLDQLLRDSYVGQPSFKGGMTEDRSKVKEIPTMVPIVVTGEDSFQETSHTDRMVLVRLTKRKRGDLQALRGVRTEGFAHAYLSWLLTGERPTVALRVKDRPGLNERQAVNVEVLKYGWHLLRSFVTDHDPTYVLPELDLSEVLAEAVEAASTNPLLDAIRWAMHAQLNEECVWMEGDMVCVQSESLLREVAKSKVFVLPVSTKQGVVKLLQEQHGGVLSRVRRPDGRRPSVVKVPLAEVLPSQE